MSRTFEFTDRAVKGLPLPPKPQQLDYFDTKERGLGLRVSYGGKRSFFVMYGGAAKRQSPSPAAAPSQCPAQSPTTGWPPARPRRA